MPQEWDAPREIVDGNLAVKTNDDRPDEVRAFEGGLYSLGKSRS